ncbi:hypothetical protein ACR3K2_19500 [Cryptosporidium serpentis]
MKAYERSYFGGRRISSTRIIFTIKLRSNLSSIFNYTEKMFSSEIIWQCVKRNSSFIHKSNGFTFTCEPYNMVAINSLKYSGLANRNGLGLDVKVNPNNQLIKKVQITKKKTGTRSTRRPNRLVTTIKLSTDPKQAKKKIENAFSHRRDLVKTAKQKYKKILKIKC